MKARRANRRTRVEHFIKLLDRDLAQLKPPAKDSMKADELFARIHEIVEEVARLDREHPTGPDEETDPRIVALLAEALKIQQQLDPIVREKYRNNPASLAEWDEIMHMCDDIKDDGPSKKVH